MTPCQSAIKSFVFFWICVPSLTHAALVTNAPRPITQRLTVNPIVARDDAGNNPATFMGSAESEIKGFVDTIWAQAGIDVSWLSPKTLNSTETLDGSQGPNGNNPRPGTDLSRDLNGLDHETIGQNAGVRVANAINMFFVDIPAGFSMRSANSSAGLAERPGNDISMFVGVNLLGFTGGKELIASVIAHEIGHNLSLPHLNVAEGLMSAGGSGQDGERLNSAQVSMALSSGMSAGVLTPVPEPNALMLSMLVGLIGVALGFATRET